MHQNHTLSRDHPCLKAAPVLILAAVDDDDDDIMEFMMK
jgi:hypothetical protein